MLFACGFGFGFYIRSERLKFEKFSHFKQNQLCFSWNMGSSGTRGLGFHMVTPSWTQLGSSCPFRWAYVCQFITSPTWPAPLLYASLQGSAGS